MNSKPCKHCVLKMMNSNIRIKYIFYSNVDGQIIRTTLKQLYYEVQTNENYHVTRGNLK